MTALLQQRAANPFYFAECFIMPMPIGKTATNLREMLQALREVDERVIRYHMWQSRMTIAHPDVEYPNDFARWAATALQDSQLAEKLSVVDPFAFEDTEQVRDTLVDLLEEYLWALPSVPWARPGFEFHFCEASTVVLRSRFAAWTLADFRAGLAEVGLDSIYYHFVDARWRLRSREMGDFVTWIKTNFSLPDLVSAIQGIDISFYTLDEVRNAIIQYIDRYGKEPYEPTE